MIFRSLAALVLSAAALTASAEGFDLVNVTLVDGTGAEPRTGISVSIRDGRIAAIADSAPAAAAGIRRIDMNGRFLLPGLIDAHAHIESPAAALRALQSGVTTARVLGRNVGAAGGGYLRILPLAVLERAFAAMNASAG